MDRFAGLLLTADECILISDALEAWWEYCDLRRAMAPDERRGAVWGRRADASVALMSMFGDAVEAALDLDFTDRSFSVVARDLGGRSADCYIDRFVAAVDAWHAEGVGSE